MRRDEDGKRKQHRNAGRPGLIACAITQNMAIIDPKWK